MRRDLTIVIPARDRPYLLELCLRSIFELQESSTRVIVSDNSSRDLTEIEGLRSRYGFEYVRQSGKLSMVDHHNVALGLVSTNWALLLHDDDELSPGVLGRLEPFLNQSISAGLILGGTQFIDEDGTAHGAWIPEAALTLRGEAAVLRLGLDFNAFPPSCVWNMAAFRQAGGFPDANGAGADYTLVLKLANENGVALFPEILGRYRVGQQQATGYSSPQRAESTLDCSITMARLTRHIGVSPPVADQLVDYMTWSIFRLVAGNLLDSHPFFVSRLCRRCERATPSDGAWRSRLKSEYPFLFWRPHWLWMLLYYSAMRIFSPAVRRKLLCRGRWTAGSLA